jgi:hypothetical protein
MGYGFGVDGHSAGRILPRDRVQRLPFESGKKAPTQAESGLSPGSTTGVPMRVPVWFVAPSPRGDFSSSESLERYKDSSKMCF